MDIVAFSLVGDVEARKRFLGLVQTFHPHITLCRLFETDRCTELLVLFDGTVDAQELQALAFQHVEGMQSGFTIHSNN